MSTPPFHLFDIKLRFWRVTLPGLKKKMADAPNGGSDSHAVDGRNTEFQAVSEVGDQSADNHADDGAPIYGKLFHVLLSVHEVVENQDDAHWRQGEIEIG